MKRVNLRKFNTVTHQQLRRSSHFIFTRRKTANTASFIEDLNIIDSIRFKRTLDENLERNYDHAASKQCCKCDNLNQVQNKQNLTRLFENRSLYGLSKEPKAISNATLQRIL